MTKYLKTIIGTVVLTALSAIIAAAQSDGLPSRHWTLLSIDGERVGATKAYIEFSDSLTNFSGSGGCNRIRGGTKIGERSISFTGVVSTRMACVDPNANRTETRLIKALERATRYRISDNVLSIYAGSRRILQFTSEAKPAVSNPVSGKLEDKKWVLDAIAGKPAGPLGKNAFINFDAAKGSAGGDSSCNAFGGEYTVTGSSLKIKNMMSTMRACIEDEKMTIERSFLDGLSQTTRFVIKGNILELYNGSRLLLSFHGENK